MMLCDNKIKNKINIKLLKNRDIIERIQGLEEIYIYINRMEKIHWEVIMGGAHIDIQKTIKMSDRSVRKPEELFGIDFQNHLNIHEAISPNF